MQKGEAPRCPVNREAENEEQLRHARKMEVIGRLRILLVDDEPAVIDVIGAILRSLGYCITAITSPLDALRDFARFPHEFDCAIVNYMMPSLTGVALAEKILEIRGDIPIMLLTGCADLVLEAKARSKGIRKIVQKPLTRRELAQAVKDLLARSVRP